MLGFLSGRAISFVALAASLCLLIPACAQAAGAKAFSDAERSEIGEIVKAYLLEHPEVLVDAMDALQSKQEAADKAKAAAVIKTRPHDVYTDGYSFVAGNPKAKLTLVEFFDYNCGYCRKAFDKMMTLASANSNVRFVFKEYPILSPESETCARAALAAGMQGKYLEFHRAMMSHPGRANEQAIDDVAKKLKLNLAKLHKDMDDPQVAAHIAANRKLGDDLALTGTPSFIVGNEVVSGWSEEELDKLIKDGGKG
jgi:protein-disulfide isomerase